MPSRRRQRPPSAPGTSIRDRDLDERDDYTSLVWLGGITALKTLNRPADAATMFARYARAAQTPQTQTKGLYWAGRAAQAAGNATAANAYLSEAAQHMDQFYGQLSAERLGRPLALSPRTRARRGGGRDPRGVRGERTRPRGPPARARR